VQDLYLEKIFYWLN